eukprot:5764926-Amphidinium_carterae.1
MRGLTRTPKQQFLTAKNKPTKEKYGHTKNPNKAAIQASLTNFYKGLCSIVDCLRPPPTPFGIHSKKLLGLKHVVVCVNQKQSIR